MSHDYHNHAPKLTNLNRAFILGIVLNAAFVFVEAATGFYTDSLGLLTDAGHNLSDVASLALAMLAFKLAKTKSSENYTYGYKKTTILVSLLNACILLIAIGGIGFEAFNRFFNPEPVAGKTVAIVAGVGIAVNAFTAFLFFKDKEHDLNVKGAYLHLAADALVSLGVVIAGIVIYYTNWFWLDTVISVVIMAVIFMSSWGLLRDSLRLSLDGVPAGIDLNNVKTAIQNIPEVKKVHHIHVWAISTTENALTGHIVLDEALRPKQIQAIKNRIKHELEHQNIGHVTLETEFFTENNTVLACSNENTPEK